LEKSCTHENQPPLLDKLIIKTEETDLNISTNKKPTNTGLYKNWTSFESLKYKINLINSLLKILPYIQQLHQCT